MSYTARFSENFELLGSLSPETANGTVGEHNTGYVSLENFHRVIIMITAGEAGGASTIDVDVEEGTSAAGAGAQNIAGKTITQLVAADEGDTVYIELRTAELDVNNDYSFINVEVTIAVDTFTSDVKIFGFTPRFAPVDVTNIAEILD